MDFPFRNARKTTAKRTVFHLRQSHLQGLVLLLLLLPFAHPLCTPLLSIRNSKISRGWNGYQQKLDTAVLVGQQQRRALGPRRVRRTMAETDTSSSSADNNNNKPKTSSQRRNQRPFQLSTALLCGGLAFDAYLEPPPQSSRWERGSQGWQVAFVSPAYTRQLYRGLLEIQIQRVTGLPSDSEDETNAAEQWLSGRGVDACLLVAVLEGQWTTDVQLLEREQYHTGVLDLTGAAHVSRSSTCWSSVDQTAAQQSEKKTGRPLPYYIPNPWLSSKGAQAVWPESESPFYLYVQDPATARLVFTVVDDVRIMGAQPVAIGSTWKLLTELLPLAKQNPTRIVEKMKNEILQEMKKMQQQSPNESIPDALEVATQQVLQQSAQAEWRGSLPLTSKPRKKDKKGQMFLAAAAGAALAGPMGAAAGAMAASFYEGQVRGAIECRIRYRPILPNLAKRQSYRVYGGMPGIDWGTLYNKYCERTTLGTMASSTTVESVPSLEAIDDGGPENKTTTTTTEGAPYRSTTNDENTSTRTTTSPKSPNSSSSSSDIDLEHCFFVSHQKTGATCAVYRSLEQKLIVVSFRGTCTPIDLITDASLVQETWVEGEDAENQLLPKVHVGFRSSMNSIARRLKELILAVPAPGDDICDYDMLVTGHSLGGALSTLFTADIGQYGIDAGRALPQLEPSEPWWKSVSNLFVQGGVNQAPVNREPPRPKSLSLYNFGSPRVGNVAFAELFDALLDEGFIDQAYRIVNGDDVVARLPRTVNAFVFGNINYEHVGTTVLIPQPDASSDEVGTAGQKSVLWIEGVSDDQKCPVRDGVSLSSPTAEGTLLNDLLSATRESFESSDVENQVSWADKALSAAGKISERMKQLDASDVASILGIKRDYTERELRIIQSLVQGKALAHHLEDEYYAGMGRASGFLAKVGEELVLLEEDGKA